MASFSFVKGVSLKSARVLSWFIIGGGPHIVYIIIFHASSSFEKTEIDPGITSVPGKDLVTKPGFRKFSSVSMKLC